MTGRGALYVLVLVVCALRPASSVASEETTSRPNLLVLLTAVSDESTVSEEQFVSELRLTLDEVAVESVNVEVEGFPSLPLTDQLRETELLVARFAATAAIWIASASPGMSVAQLVFANKGDSLVRTVEAGSNKELALAVRELLVDAYIVKKKEPPEKPPEEKESEKNHDPSPWGILPIIEASGGLVGNQNATMILGGGLGVERMSKINLLVRALILGKIGPWDRTADDLVLGWRVALRLEVGYLWRAGIFGVGPIASVSVLFSSIAMSLGAGDSQTHDWWSFRGALGFEIRWQLAGRVALLIDLLAGGLSSSEKFVRRSDGSTVLQTPYMDLAGTLGVVLSF